MSDAFIFDAVRTPRGKGKKDGSLHQITPVHLVGNLLNALQQRNDLDTSQVDDVVLGCVTPVGEQGADIARTAVHYAGWDESVAGVTQSRFCASGLESVNLAAMKVMSGQEDLVVAGGIESMSRWPMGTDGGAMAMDPRVNQLMGFVPQGIGADLIASLEGFSRTDVDAFAVRLAAAGGPGAGRRPLRQDPCTGHRCHRTDRARPRRDHPWRDHGGVPGQSQGQFPAKWVRWPSMPRAMRKYPTVERINHVHHAGNSSGIVDGSALMLVGSKEMGSSLGLKPRARASAAPWRSPAPSRPSC